MLDTCMAIEDFYKRVKQILWILLAIWAVKVCLEIHGKCKMGNESAPATSFMRWAPVLLVLSVVTRITYLVIWDWNYQCSRTLLEAFHLSRLIARCLSDIVMFWYATELLKAGKNSKNLLRYNQRNETVDGTDRYWCSLVCYIIFIVVTRTVSEVIRYSQYGYGHEGNDTAYYTTPAYAVFSSIFIFGRFLTLVPFLWGLWLLFLAAINTPHSRKKIVFAVHFGIIFMLVISQFTRSFLLMEHYTREPNKRQQFCNQKEHSDFDDSGADDFEACFFSSIYLFMHLAYWFNLAMILQDITKFKEEITKEAEDYERINIANRYAHQASQRETVDVLFVNSAPRVFWSHQQ